MSLLQMLEDFATPPSSPPLGGVAGILPEALRHHNIKASSVTWCTDYLEVMGCEKQHNFKVCHAVNSLQTFFIF